MSTPRNENYNDVASSPSARIPASIAPYGQQCAIRLEHNVTVGSYRELSHDPEGFPLLFLARYILQLKV